MRPKASIDRWSGRLAGGAGVGITLFVLALHLRQFVHGGALWRDEVNGVHVATIGTLGELWSRLEFESSPLQWFLALRAWSALGLAGSDAGFRLFGMLIGLAVVAALWFTARRAGAGVPILGLLLLALNPEVLHWGDSVRAYGLGLVWIVLAFHAIWRFTLEADRRSLVLATIASVLCAQALYTNAFVLFGICTGAIVVSLRRRHWRRAAGAFGIGLAAAASLLPYLPIVRAQSAWAALNQSPVGLTDLLRRFRQALDAQHPALTFVWLALALVAIGGTALANVRPAQPGLEARQQDRALYGATAGVVGIVVLFFFLVRFGYPTQSWYYLPAIALGALGLDAALAPLWRSARGRLVQVVVALVLVAVSWPAAWRAAGERFTNVDQAATMLERAAAAGDIIVVAPWYLGISFGYYYRGEAEWMMLPFLEDTTVHRYDLLKRRMVSEAPLRPLLRRAEATLGAKRRVWIVRTIGRWPRGRPPAVLPSAPQSRYGWSSSAYNRSWASQLDHLLWSRADRFGRLPLPDVGPLGRFEVVRVDVAE